MFWLISWCGIRLLECGSASQQNIKTQITSYVCTNYCHVAPVTLTVVTYLNHSAAAEKNLHIVMWMNESFSLKCAGGKTRSYCNNCDFQKSWHWPNFWRFCQHLIYCWLNNIHVSQWTTGGSDWECVWWREKLEINWPLAWQIWHHLNTHTHNFPFVLNSETLRADHQAPARVCIQLYSESEAGRETDFHGWFYI